MHRVGRYVLHTQLGVGATATAWRARDTRTGREVCLKLLHPHLLHDPVARARLESEAAAAIDVSHPALLALLDVHVTGSEAALIFPLIEGETLAARMGNGSRLAPRAAASVALDICGALDAVHRRGVVHRDVKPSNILLGADGGTRLLDFGISHALALPADELTGPGMTVGTLPYMSPEQLAGLSPEPANDVYALGAVLYEMLAGRRPYDVATPDDLAAAQLHPPADVADAPRPLLALAWAALARDAAARPTAGQMVEGLRAWLDDGALPAPPLALAPAQPLTSAMATSAVARGTLARPGPAPDWVPGAPAQFTPRRNRVTALGAALVGILGLAVVAALAFAPPSLPPAPVEAAAPSAAPSRVPDSPARPAAGRQVNNSDGRQNAPQDEKRGKRGNKGGNDDKGERPGRGNKDDD